MMRTSGRAPTRRMTLARSLSLLGIALLLAAAAIAAAAAPSASAGTAVNVPGRDAAVALYDMGKGRAALYGFRCDGSASSRVKMWSGRLPVKRCKIAAGDFNSDGYTDAMVLVDLGKRRSRMLLFASNGTRFSQVASWTSKRGAFNSEGASVAVGGWRSGGGCGARPAPCVDGQVGLRQVRAGGPEARQVHPRAQRTRRQSRQRRAAPRRRDRRRFPR